jgi:hypothetical protein
MREVSRIGTAVRRAGGIEPADQSCSYARLNLMLVLVFTELL